MFSPFRDAGGAPKGLAEVTWDDLSQLADLDEGFVLEFKREYGPSVQRKVPKIIASFANSRGGWLVIGVDDDTHAVRPIERREADFSQIFGELCRRHVSPAPPFDVRFLPDPADDARGVVLVRVDEGDFPPYIADGVVEIREGSTSGPATGASLVELYGKATGRRREIAEFCNRTVFYPDEGPDGRPLPLFDLYLYRMGRPEGAPSRAEVAEHVAAMRAAFADQRLSCHVSHAHDSRIVRNSLPAGPSDVHSAIELFVDESMKLTVPAVLLGRDERAGALARMRELGLFSADEGAPWRGCASSGSSRPTRGASLTRAPRSAASRAWRRCSTATSAGAASHGGSTPSPTSWRAWPASSCGATAPSTSATLPRGACSRAGPRTAAAACATSTTGSTTRSAPVSLPGATSSRRAACRSARPTHRTAHS